MSLPTSCTAILPTVTKDLGVTLKKVEAKDQTSTEFRCNYWDGPAAYDNGEGYIQVSWGVSKTVQMASLTFGMVSGMTMGDEKSAAVPGLGDKAVAVTSKGTVIEVGVLSGRSILTVGHINYDTPIPLAKWTALAKDLLAGNA